MLWLKDSGFLFLSCLVVPVVEVFFTYGIICRGCVDVGFVQDSLDSEPEAVVYISRVCFVGRVGVEGRVWDVGGSRSVETREVCLFSGCYRITSFDYIRKKYLWWSLEASCTLNRLPLDMLRLAQSRIRLTPFAAALWQSRTCSTMDFKYKVSLLLFKLEVRLG